MQISTIAAIGLRIKHFSNMITKKIPNININKKQEKNQDFTLEEILIPRPGYEQHGKILRKKLDDSKIKLKNIEFALNKKKIKPFFFKKECREVKEHIESSLVLINAIEEIMEKQIHSNTKNDRETLEFIIGQINEIIANIIIEDNIDYSMLNNISTVFVALSVAVWTYLINTNILPQDNFAGISIPFFLNLLPLTVQIFQFTALQIFKIKNGDSSEIVKIYQSLLPALNDIKELLYEEEINGTLSTLQKNCEKIIAQQREHQDEESYLLHAIKKISHKNKNEFFEEKVMDAAMKNPDLEYQIKESLIQSGEDKDHVYAIFDTYRKQKYFNSIPVFNKNFKALPSSSTASSSFYTAHSIV